MDITNLTEFQNFLGFDQNLHFQYCLVKITDYGHPERKYPSLHGRKFNPNPKFLGTAEAYFVCHIGPIFQISLIYAFIGCPQSVGCGMPNLSQYTAKNDYYQLFTFTHYFSGVTN